MTREDSPPEVKFFAGQYVFDANDAVIQKLKEVGALITARSNIHQYPKLLAFQEPHHLPGHEQWFISMEKNGFRQKALEAIDKVKWIPHWGHDRSTA